jgi:hypothetical protein
MVMVTVAEETLEWWNLAAATGGLPWPGCIAIALSLTWVLAQQSQSLRRLADQHAFGKHASCNLYAAHPNACTLSLL